MPTITVTATELEDKLHASAGAYALPTIGGETFELKAVWLQRPQIEIRRLIHPLDSVPPDGRWFSEPVFTGTGGECFAWLNGLAWAAALCEE